MAEKSSLFRSLVRGRPIEGAPEATAAAHLAVRMLRAGTCAIVVTEGTEAQPFRVLDVGSLVGRIQSDATGRTEKASEREAPLLLVSRAFPATYVERLLDRALVVRVTAGPVTAPVAVVSRRDLVASTRQAPEPRTSSPGAKTAA